MSQIYYNPNVTNYKYLKKNMMIGVKMTTNYNLR